MSIASPILTNRSTENFPVNPPGVYYVSQDSRALVTALYTSIVGTNVDSAIQDALNRMADTYWQQVVNCLRQNFDVNPFAEADISNQLYQAVQAIVEQTPDAVVVCLDRFLLENTNLDVQRFKMSRNVNGVKQPRQGSQSFVIQLAELKRTIGTKQVILVDDGMFSGGTMEFALDLLTQSGIQVSNIVVFLAKEGIDDVQGIPVTACQTLSNLLEWVDARDLSLFGGRIERQTASCTITSTKPYIAPFSNGANASLNTLDTFSIVSQRLLQAQIGLFKQLEQLLGNSVTMRDFIQAGFPKVECPALGQITLNSRLVDIAERAYNLLMSQERSLPAETILDMDGTLYALDGEGMFAQSSLGKAVRNNAILYFMKLANCSELEATKIVDSDENNKIGLSNVASATYNCSRTTFFQNVWGPINPADIFAKNKDARTTVAAICANTNITLLTAAPRVWANKVLAYLEIDTLLPMRICAEDFTSKTDVFKAFAANYEPATVLSIGDQFTTDIAPAAALGMQTFLVNQQNPLLFLTQFKNV